MYLNPTSLYSFDKILSQLPLGVDMVVLKNAMLFYDIYSEMAVYVGNNLLMG